MRHLAVDLGTKRVGLALSDAGGAMATPLTVLTVATPEQALREVTAIALAEGVDRLVVGCPLDMDHDEGKAPGKAARSAAAWAVRLGESAGLPVVLVDERLSSFAAEQQLARRKRSGERLTRGRKKKQLDAIAAATFLQELLDGSAAALTPESLLKSPDKPADASAGPRGAEDGR